MKDLLYGTFSLLAVWRFLASLPEPLQTRGPDAHLASRDGSALWNYWLATVFFMLAMLSKPTAVILPLVALPLVWLRWGHVPSLARKRLLICGAARNPVYHHRQVGTAGSPHTWDCNLAAAARGRRRPGVLPLQNRLAQDPARLLWAESCIRPAARLYLVDMDRSHGVDGRSLDQSPALSLRVRGNLYLRCRPTSGARVRQLQLRVFFNRRRSLSLPVHVWRGGDCRRSARAVAGQIRPRRYCGPGASRGTQRPASPLLARFADALRACSR